jgi:hypothetical protein
MQQCTVGYISLSSYTDAKLIFTLVSFPPPGLRLAFLTPMIFFTEVEKSILKFIPREKSAGPLGPTGEKQGLTGSSSQGTQGRKWKVNEWKEEMNRSKQLKTPEKTKHGVGKKKKSLLVEVNKVKGGRGQGKPDAKST